MFKTVSDTAINIFYKKIYILDENFTSRYTCSYKSMSFLSGSFRDCMAFKTVSQCPLLISAQNPSTLSTVFSVTPVSS